MRARVYSHLVIVLFLSMALGLSACAGKSGSSKFYVLNPVTSSDMNPYEGGLVGVLPVVMPDYLDRPQIVTRLSQNQIRFDEFSRWAESLKENFHTVLVQNLCSLLQTEKIVRSSQNPGIPTVMQIIVEVVSFDGTLGGDVSLNARWALLDTEKKRILISRKFFFREPTGAATYEALVAAHSRALAHLSREIGESILMRR